MRQLTLTVAFLVLLSAPVTAQDQGGVGLIAIDETPGRSETRPALSEVEALRVQLHLARLRIAELAASLADTTAKLDSVILTRERQSVTPVRGGWDWSWDTTDKGELVGFVSAAGPEPEETEEP